MAASNSVADIGVKLTADTTAFDTAIERSSRKLSALRGTTSASGKGRGAARGTTVAGASDGDSRYAVKGEVTFTKAQATRAFKVATEGLVASVPMKITRSSIAEAKAAILSGIGTVPVTIAPKFAEKGSGSITQTMGAVLAMQYGITQTQGRALFKETASKAMPGGPPKGLASGGPVSAMTPVVVGERRPEVFVPKVNGRILPNADNFRREIRNLDSLEREISQRQHRIKQSLQDVPHAMRGRGVRGYGGKLGVQPGPSSSAVAEPGWLYHATDNLDAIRGRVPGSSPGVRPLTESIFSPPSSFWATSPAPNYGGSLVRAPFIRPAPGRPALGGFESTGDIRYGVRGAPYSEVFQSEDVVPRSALQYWGEDERWHGFRKGRTRTRPPLVRRQDGGPIYAMAGTRPMKEGDLHKKWPYRRQRNTIEQFIQNRAPQNNLDFRDWYAIAQAQARGDMADFGYQGDPDIGLLAAANLSPGMAWPNNRALFRQLLQGVPPGQMSASGFVPGFGDVGGGVSRGRGPFRRAEKVLRARTLQEALRLSTGPKVHPFGLNLTGLDPTAGTYDARMFQIATNDQQIVRMSKGVPKIGVIGGVSEGPFRRDTIKAYESLFRKYGDQLGARNISEFQAILWSSKGRGADLGDDWARSPSGIVIPRHPGIAVPVMRMAGGPVDLARDWRKEDWRRAFRPEQVPTQNLMRFMHVDREVTPKPGGGRWYLDELTEKIGSEGFLEDFPLKFYYDPDAHKGLLGDGNHRFAAAACLSLPTVPVDVYNMRGSAGTTGKTPYKSLLGPKTTFPDEFGYIPENLPASWIGLQRPEDSEYHIQRFLKRREQYLRELPRKGMGGFAHAQHGVKFSLRDMRSGLGRRTRDTLEDLLASFPIIGTKVDNPDPQFGIPGFPSLGRVGVDWTPSNALAYYGRPGQVSSPGSQGYGRHFEPGHIMMSGYYSGKKWAKTNPPRQWAPSTYSDKTYDRSGRMIVHGEEQTNFHTLHGRNIEGVAAHEFGHAAERFIMGTFPPATSIGMSYERLRDDLMGSSRMVYDTKNFRDREIFRQGTAKSVSGYGGSDAEEAFAELFAERFLGGTGAGWGMKPGPMSQMDNIQKQLASFRSIDDLDGYINNARARRSEHLTSGGIIDMDRLREAIGIRHAGVGSRALKDTLAKYYRNEPAGGTYPVADLPVPTKGYAVGIPQLLGGASIPVQLDPNNLTTKGVREFITAFRTQQGMGAPYVGTWLNPGGIIDVDPSTVVHTRRAAEMILRAGGEHAAFDLGRFDEVWSSHSDRGVGGKNPELIANPRHSRATPERILDAIYEGRAKGGKSPHGLYIVGEIGKELFVPDEMSEAIPKKVMDQIPKAAGGTRVIGQKRNELFAPPSDGWIIPNRLLDQVPHLMPRVDGGPVDEWAGTPWASRSAGDPPNNFERLLAEARDKRTGPFADPNAGQRAGGPQGQGLLGTPKYYRGQLFDQSRANYWRAPTAIDAIHEAPLTRGVGTDIVGLGEVPTTWTPGEFYRGGTRPFSSDDWSPGANPLIGSRGASGPLGSRMGLTSGTGGMLPYATGLGAGVPEPRDMFPVAPRSSVAGAEGAYGTPYQSPVTMPGAAKPADMKDFSFDNVRVVNIEAGQASVESRQAGTGAGSQRAGDGSGLSQPFGDSAAMAEGAQTYSNILDDMKRGGTEWQQRLSSRTPRGGIAYQVSETVGGGARLKKLQRQLQLELRALDQMVEGPRGEYTTEQKQERRALAGAYVEYPERLEAAQQIIDPKDRQRAIDDLEATRKRAKDVLGEGTLKQWDKAQGTLKKLDIGFGSVVRQMGSVIAGIGIYGVAMSAFGSVMQAGMPAIKTWIDGMRGWQATASTLTTQLGEQTKQQWGNVDAVMAMKSAQAGLSGETSAYMQAILGPVAAVKAGAKAMGETEELFKAASYSSERPSVEGLYGGYGGLMGGGILAEMLGGGKGFSETMRGTFANIRGSANGPMPGLDVSPIEGAAKYVAGKFGFGDDEFTRLIDSLTKAGTGYEDLLTSSMDAWMGVGSIESLTRGAGLSLDDIERVTGTRYGLGDTPSFEDLKAIDAAVGQRPGAGEAVGPEWGFFGKQLNSLANAFDDTLGDAGLYDRSKPRREAAIARGEYLQKPFEERIAESLGLGENRSVNAGLNAGQIERRNLALGDIKEAEDRGYEAVGLIANATWEVTGNQEKLMKGFMTAWEAGDWDGVLRVVEDGIVPMVNGTVATMEEYEKILQQTAVGKTIVDPNVWAGINKRQLTAQYEQTRLSSERQFGLTEFAVSQQQVTAPLIRPGAAFFGGTDVASVQAAGGGSASAEISTLLGDAQKAQQQVRDLAKEGWKDMLADVEAYAPDMVGDFNKLKSAAMASQSAIKQTTTRMAVLQQEANQANWDNQIRIAQRSLGDAIGMLGQVGGTRLGYLQREQFLAGRASQSLGLAAQKISLVSQELSLALQKRQIATQLAVAQFQAPGETGEERYARQREAIIRAGIQRRQVGLQEQGLGISKQQYGIAERQFVLAGQLWAENAKRAAVDAQLSIDVMRKSRKAESFAIAAQARIAAESQVAANVMRKINIITGRANANFSQALGTAASNVGQFSGDVEAASGIILNMLQAAGQTDYVDRRRRQEAEEHRPGRKRAAGFLGTVDGETTMTMGEAGAETVAILRNPRRALMSGGGGGGGGPINLTINLNNPSVRSDGDAARLAKNVAHEVERVLSRKGQLLGLRAPGY